MKVTLVQSNIVWENKERNIEYFTKVLSGLKNNTDLVILPEMFTTGFSLNPSELSEPFPGLTLQWMKELADLNCFAICGSYIVQVGNDFFNRLVFVKPDGGNSVYDKRHLFSIGGEDKIYKRGVGKVIVQYKGFRINLQICYDLRFPVWSRNKGDYDLLVNVASWPESRREAWLTLLRARAIENQCFVAGVNRTGKDGNGISYSGDSILFDPYGGIVRSAGIDEEKTVTAIISVDDIVNAREKFPVWKDADDFTINK